jgi:hypothetical protein
MLSETELERRRKISQTLKGRKKTEEHCRNISLGQKGIPRPYSRGPRPEWVKEKMRGPKTEQHKANIKLHHAHYWKGKLGGNYNAINHSWYTAVHNWIYRQVGKPKQCEKCLVTSDQAKIHWANVSQEYKREISDWLALCAKCHRFYDIEFYKNKLRKESNVNNQDGQFYEVVEGSDGQRSVR